MAFLWSIIILSITFEHSVYYLLYSLMYIINTDVIHAISLLLVVCLINVPCTWVLHHNLINYALWQVNADPHK